MPDPIVMAEATGLAMLTAAVVLGLSAWWGRRRRAGRSWADAGWVVGIGAGSTWDAGCSRSSRGGRSARTWTGCWDW